MREANAVKIKMREFADSPLVFDEVPEWLEEAVINNRVVPEFRSEDYWYYRVTTPRGVVLASPGQWIAHNILDELHVLNEQPPQPKDFWKFCQDNLREVMAWPAWMRGGKV